jgi:hypothetical protein
MVDYQVRKLIGETMPKEAAGPTGNGTMLHLHTTRSGIPAATAFEIETGMTPATFEQKLENGLGKLESKIDDIRRELTRIATDADVSTALDRERNRKLDDHEEILHGDNNLMLRMDRLEQSVKLAKWGFNLMLTMTGALAVILLEYLVKHLG